MKIWFKQSLCPFCGFVGACFLVSCFGFFANWLANRYQVNAVDLVFPLTQNLITALLIGGIFWRTFKRNHLIGLAVGCVVINLLTWHFNDRLSVFSGLIKLINPFTPTSQLVDEVIYVLIIFVSFWFLARFGQNLIDKKQIHTEVIFKSILIAICVAFAIQFFQILRIVIIEWPQFNYRPNAISASLNSNSDKPDIYYIVLDRYTNSSVLKSQFNFDNSEFLNNLTKNGFVINNDAYSNYPFTTMSISSTLNANYHSQIVSEFSTASEQTLEPFHNSIRQSTVIQKLKDVGYKYIELGSWYEAANQAPLADEYLQPDGQLTILNKQITLNTFSKTYLDYSWFGQVIHRGVKIKKFILLGISGISEADATKYKINKLKNIANQNSGGRVIFAHFLIPHEPYLFNADGSLSNNSSSDDVGLPIKTKYVNQIKYINSQMTEIISLILEKSQSKAVIVLQADEGAYPMQLNGEITGEAVEEELSSSDMRNWSDADLKMKYGVLAAYHIPAATESEIKTQADSVNVFRLIFNTYFDAKMDILPKCYYAYPNGRSQAFVFADITERLTGSKNPACSENSSFK